MYKKYLLLFLVISPFLANAQADQWLNKVNNKIKAKATARADRKIDQAIDKTLDAAEGKTQPAVKKETNAKPADQASPSPGNLYGKYDFIPGAEIIYSNNFAADQAGELPTGWNSNGSGAVVKVDAFKGNWVQLHQNTAYLTDNALAFTENCTIEFDLILRRTNPKAAFPEFTWGILSSGTSGTTDNALLKNPAAQFATEMNLQPSDNSNASIHLQTLNNGSVYLNTDIKKPVRRMQVYNDIIHVAMQVQKERLRIWFNEEKLYDLPKAITAGTSLNQLYFVVKRYGGADQEVGYLISNIKIAKGLPDTRHKLVEEGKFSTTGILFEVNAAKLLPESNGVLREIAAILTKHPELQIDITGHTDSDGSDSDNLELSKKRAAAVKQALISEFNIEASRMETNGAGESQPVAGNNTKEGKANNRRVEFRKRN